MNPSPAFLLTDNFFPAYRTAFSIVVPPEVTEDIVKQCKKLNIKKIWMQPGSESKKAIDYCKKNNIELLNGVCILLENKKT